jgi:hypothetical protein
VVEPAEPAEPAGESEECFNSGDAAEDGDDTMFLREASVRDCLGCFCCPVPAGLFLQCDL